jgi:hypothetical protein
MYISFMGFIEQFLGKPRTVVEFVGRLVTSPIRNHRAEKLRIQQAEALIAKDNLTPREIRQLGDLGMATSNTVPSTVLSMEVATKMLDIIANRKYARDPQSSL